MDASETAVGVTRSATTTGATRAALVTGASRGIGAAIAERLVDEGWDLTVSARGQDPLDRMAARLTGARRVEAVAADMSIEGDVRRLAAAHIASHGRLDALVLNAGMGSRGALADFPLRRFDLLYSINVRSAFVLLQETLPTLRATAALSDSGAKVIAVSSLLGVVSEPFSSAYGATKAALTSLCESLNTEESAGGVTASAVSPGYVATDMTAGLGEVLDPRDMLLTSDVAEMVVALTRLSRSVVVPNVVLTRPGPCLWRA